jgi:uncharacterized protein YkwD
MIRFIFIFILLISSCEKKDDIALVDYLEPIDSSAVGLTGDENIATPGFSQEYMKLLNDHRTKLGLNPLIHNLDLAKLSTEHSTDMANGSVSFGHSGFSMRCEEARSVLGGGNLCAENVAMGQKTPLGVFNAWLSSSGHRANMEQPRSTHTGFGFKQNQNGTYYWTQIFIELD